MILGCVLAGGQSSRFGSDKALAELGGHTLLARAVDMLSGWCEHVVVVGRETAPAPTLPDWPRPGMGPLGGIAAALHLARDEGYEAVLTCGVDSAGLPENLPDLLAPAPGLSRGPAGDRPVARQRASQRSRRSSTATGRAFDAAASPRRSAHGRCRSPADPANINTPADLAAAGETPWAMNRQPDFGTPEVRSATRGHADHRRARGHRARRHQRDARGGASAAGRSPSSAPPTTSQPSARAGCAWSRSRGCAARRPAAPRPVAEGMVVHTQTPRLAEAAEGVMELYISDHPLDCLTCSANNDCELQDRPPRRSACAMCAMAMTGANHLGLADRHARTPISISIPANASPARAACAPATKCRARSR